MAYHGYPRFTGDIDIFIQRSSANASILKKALDDFGFGSLGFKEEDFQSEGIVVQLGRPPNRIDILTSIDGVEFDEAWAMREEAVIDGMPIGIISKALLLQKKRASRRPKDLEDLRQLGGSTEGLAGDQ